MVFKKKSGGGSSTFFPRGREIMAFVFATLIFNKFTADHSDQLAMSISCQIYVAKINVLSSAYIIYLACLFMLVISLM